MSNRDYRNGQYTYSNLDRFCVCGHTLGIHAAEAPHSCSNNGPGYPTIDCECMKFRPTKKQMELTKEEKEL